MKKKRVMYLLNTLISYMLSENGGDVGETIDILLDLGFTKQELVDDFSFDAEDVESSEGSI